MVTDLQEGRAVFKLALRSKEWIEAHYPDTAALIDEHPVDAAELMTDEILSPDPKEARLLLEYWWREYDAKSEIGPAPAKDKDWEYS